MKLFIRLALMLAGSAAVPACLFAQTPGGAVAAPPAPPGIAAPSTNGIGPRIAFNTESFNAGTNIVGDPVHYTFIVTNTGDELLVLSSVHAGCGCTTVINETNSSGAVTTLTREIPPGQTGIIPIKIATTGLRGPFSKSVAVTSNDRTRPNVNVFISGISWEPIEAPTVANFRLGRDATNLNSQVFKILNHTDTPLSLSDPRRTSDLFSAVLKTNVPGHEFELTISAALPSHLAATTGSTIIQGEISLQSSATNRNPLIVSVFEEIRPEIEVFPTYFTVPIGYLARAITNPPVTIREDKTNFTLFDPVVNVPGVQAFLAVMQTNRIYSLSVSFPQGFQAQAGEKINVTMKTDNPNFPTISVPILPVPAPAQPARPPFTPSPARTALLPPGARAGLAVPANATNTQATSPNPAPPANTRQP